MAKEDGFVKVVVETGTGRILGAHVVSPHAAILVQQLVYVMSAEEGTPWPGRRRSTRR